ncbi:hypothetical protein [Absidia glauca]|uniref:F-box domain-containing protein n=1 Tax=Absidia glauca TaxID=4829 RepID=A0A163JZR0_ABSGL|nr:hypothetical protein [Absidia glauca]
MSTIRQLPFETISAIVNHIDNPHDLYQCTLTNTAFYKVTNPKLWHDPTKVKKLSYYDFVHILVNDRQKKHNLRSLPLGHYIRRLDLTMVFGDSKMKAAIVLLFAYTPLLEIVTIASIRPIDASDRLPPDPMRTIDEMSGRSFYLVPEFLPILCPRLREIAVTGFNDDFLKNLGNCRQLRTLDLDDLFFDNSYDGLASLRNCPLNSFFMNSNMWKASNNIRDLQQLTRLSTLDITTMDEETDELVEQLLFTSPQPSNDIAFPRLETLRIFCQFGQGMSTHALVHILTTYSKLQELYTKVFNLSIIQGHVLPHLRSLTLIDEGLTSKEVIHSWIKACPGLIDFSYKSDRDSDDDDENLYHDTSDMHRIRSVGLLEARRF